MNLQGGGNGSHSGLQDYFSCKRSLKGLLHFTGDDSGYIEGKVFMTWPPRNKLDRLNLEVMEDSVLYRFEVEVPHKDGITFRPHERISLALTGVRVDRRKASSSPHYFPIVLRFPDGVILKYLSGANADKVVDSREGNTVEWYDPVTDAPVIDAPVIQHNPILTVARPCIPFPPRRVFTNHEGTTSECPPAVADEAAVPSVRLAQQPDTVKAVRFTRRRRKKRKLHNDPSTAAITPVNDTDNPCSVDGGAPCHEQPQNLVHSTVVDVPCGYPKPYQVAGQTSEAASVREGSRVEVSGENNCGNVIPVSGEPCVPTSGLKAGIRTERGDVFTALGDLQKGSSLINVIGIVASASSERKTSTNEWRRSFALVDPSTIDSARQTISVSCFQKKYPEWLPQVQKDDVVILRRLKISEFNGAMTATGYCDKLRWAVYDPLKNSIRPPHKGSAPEKEILDEGMGYEYSPFWEPSQDSEELEYCRKIGEWWKNKRELERETVSMVQCSETRRQHLLISEASPDRPPRGFFDCTVEVLQKFDNSGGATIVYVTDYTANALVHPVHATWCPPELRCHALRCDMWDAARNIAMMMSPGEYWYLHNIRAKWNLNQHMEGTMRLAEKTTQLDPTKLETRPHLRALLARKTEFESRLTLGLGSLHIFPEMFLQDVESSTSFLTCVVELLHSELSSRDGHFIYVTDYTFNADLPTAISAAEWAHNLEHRVLKIKLDDAQAKNSSGLMPGSVLIIRNLRIKRSDASGDIRGCLGGDDTLILSSNDSSSHQAQTLQRNKEIWTREIFLNGLTIRTSESSEEARGPSRQLSASLDSITIQEAVARPAPGVFRVLARAMDFFPFLLEDACALRCTKCQESPPPSFKRCPRCDDMAETHCKWFYCFYLQLQDEKGDEVIISLSGKECTLLQDIGPTDFRSDRTAFSRFLAKLDPILGNLKDVHAAWSRNEHKVIESPLMVFTIESWDVGDEKGYGLLNCIPHPTN